MKDYEKVIEITLAQIANLKEQRADIDSKILSREELIKSLSDKTKLEQQSNTVDK